MAESSKTCVDDKSWHTFQRDDQFLYPEAQSMKYRSRKTEEKTVVHWGQRKLGLTVLQFLNLYCDFDARPKVIYAGAASGRNIGFLARLYPQLEWHLYDPSRFSINSAPNIKIYTGDRGWFDDNIAKQWGEAVAQGQPVLFISDIRSIDTKDATRKELSEEIVESGVWRDMEAQQRWVRIIKPIAAHLKFRLPYPNVKFSENIDHMKGMAPYMAGVVYLQPWVGPTSAESRLVVTPNEDGEYPDTMWDLEDYESKMFYHNCVTREGRLFHNPIGVASEDEEMKMTSLYGIELLNGWDDMMEYLIFNDYLQVVGESNRHEKIQALCDLLSQWISSGETDITLDFLRRNPYYLKRSKPRGK